MGKLDKKVLKVINMQDDKDFDVDDISVALKCDDDEVQEALDSLKDQGLIEAVIHNGKIFWKPARTDSFELADNPDMTQHPIKDESSIDLLILEQPSRATVLQEQNKFQRTSEPQRTFRPVERIAHSGHQEQMTRPSMSTGRPMQQAFENEMIDDNTRSFAPQIQPAKLKAPSTDDDFDDEFDRPRRAGSSIGALAVAVLLSAGVSALIAFSLSNNATKGFNGSIAALEGKITESSAKLGQRLDALSVMVDNIKKDIAAQPPIAAPVKEEVRKPPAKPSPKQSVRSTRSTAAKKAASRRAVASKKRKTPAEIIQETSESATSSEAGSSSATPEAAPSVSSEPTGEMTNVPSASEPSSSPTYESGSSPAASEPSASGAMGDGNPPASTDGSGQ